MAGSKEEHTRKRSIERLYNSWNKRGRDLVIALLEDEQIQKDIETIRGWGKDKIAYGTMGLLRKHQIPTLCFEVFANYIDTGQLNHFFMRSPVVVVDTASNTAFPSLAINDGVKFKEWVDKEMAEHAHLYLVLDPECTRTDLEEFIRDYWSLLIQPRLESLKPVKYKRVRPKTFTKRDQQIASDIEAGKPAKEATEGRGDISPEHARQIKYLHTKKRKA